MDKKSKEALAVLLPMMDWLEKPTPAPRSKPAPEPVIPASLPQIPAMLQGPVIPQVPQL